MRNTAVLFRGSDQVVEAYEAMDIPAWSMWAGKDQLLFSYSGDEGKEPNMTEGVADLRQALDMLRRGGTDAQLTLKVYADLPNGKIKSNTPFDNSFGFKLFANEEESPAVANRTQGYKNLEQRIDQLTALVTQQQTEQEEEKPGGIMGVIGSLFETPGLKEFVVAETIGVIKKFFNRTPQPPVATMAGVKTETAQQGSNWETLPADQKEKLTQAMEMLMGADPLIGDHLMGLANIAVNQPSKYQMALKFL